MTDAYKHEVKAHGGVSSVFTISGPIHWREPKPEKFQSFRTCSYCGSIHPADLAAGIAKGATGNWADFKYGWPHKLYIDGMPDPYAGQEEQYGTNADKTPMLRTRSATVWAKFYTEHLQDATPEEKAVIEKVMRLSFEFDNKGGVRWKPVAPEQPQPPESTEAPTT